MVSRPYSIGTMVKNVTIGRDAWGDAARPFTRVDTSAPIKLEDEEINEIMKSPEREASEPVP